MSLREELILPFIVEATEDHSHTVIFLHRFPQETTAEELPTKVLSAKLTKNHKTLAQQFPTIRWIFPYPKLHANDTNGRLNNQHWKGLSTEEVERLELPFGPALPYITQIVFREAQLADGLDKIILRGQGDGAIAAHDACTSFPELSEAHRQRENIEKGFLGHFFHNPEWTKLEQLKMAGFVGMHAQDGRATRDESDYILSRRTSNARIVNHTILRQTPHKFIRGGYKTQTITWDGPRIDAFASFLNSLGITRHGFDKQLPSLNPGALAPKVRQAPEEQKAKPEITAQQRHALEIMESKKADEEARRRILMRIEEDKRNRKYRQEDKRIARQQAPVKDTEKVISAGPREPSVESEEAEPERESRSANWGRKKRLHGWENWATMPEELKMPWEPQKEGSMSEAQLKALGIWQDDVA
ncbi:hypothetical protein DL764_000600 [Monosporascus ibericus]|uniref:Uncharacterized protein n=1 Tax=Monosporascus ibericus TaxID=155417 RepID=A0A4Q4TWA8_9PEZI|nr:hypothetical protein DL764_000600 [Monosporascus ibericus]